ncbi:RNA-binding protein [Falsibacillus albus]|uniref:RNA-binding protein n=2 Tax=Falsibacillus albus TaxID=2478915 RepID=A0A3L7K5E4_9BACI|nr:RNA-binding protein [Falsibacillus albus]
MNSLYQHFRPEEREFVDQVMEWRQFVEDSYSPKLTDFLDPRQQKITESLLGKNQEIFVRFNGGSAYSERKRAIIYPSYYEPQEADFSLGLAEIVYPKKFVRLDHRQILGSIMSLGVRRDKFGDILVTPENIQLVFAKEIADYLQMQFTHVGKTKIEIKNIEWADLSTSTEEWKESQTTVSSLRLDAVLSSVTNSSRQKVQALIKAGQVKVNWRVVEQGAFQCEAGDIISARGFGRSKIMSIEGMTKKEKWRIVVGVLK